MTPADPSDLPPLEDPAPLAIDRAWMTDLLVRMLRTPSPSGRTDAVMQLVGDTMAEIGLPFELTRRGAMVAELPGASSSVDRAVVVHADTIGCMVRALKDNGRLAIIPIGSFSARFAEGARVTIFVEDPDRIFSGTVLPLKASGHAFGDEIDEQGVGWDHVEVRVDQRAHSAEDLRALGFQVGDSVALVASPEITDAGFLVSRHLDGKAGVAAALAAAKAIVDGGVVPQHKANLLVTIAEEVGHGASHGLGDDVAEMVSIDNAVCAPGQHSIEHGVTIPMADMTGPFDYHLTRRLLRLCRNAGIPHASRHLQVVPLRCGRRPRGRRRHPGGADRLRARRQPRLGAHGAGLGRRRRPAADHLAADAADVRLVGRHPARAPEGVPLLGPAGARGGVGPVASRRGLSRGGAPGGSPVACRDDHRR
ncbi:osmoprotectant NAGGN system M42 family peptidase [Aquihabitans sp. G128]|nr:osmoprotectant NAGGN system M42 family peptidase [Aquihabitans sp. G128]QXC62655.1 osmoprotectant NAGGN system M42 family peptidase [Aquihabitans sp. G128]